MNSKNENNSALMENTVSQLSGFERWLITKQWRLWVTMIVGGALLHYVPTKVFGSYWWMWSPAPSTTAGGDIVRQGIELFSGNILVTSWGLAHTTCLVSIIFLYMAIPTLFFTSWRQLKQSDLSSIGKKSFRRTFITFMISGAFTLSIVVFSWPVAIIAVRVSQSMSETQAKQANKDAITADLNQLGYKAREFYFIPVSLGGGGGRWRNILTTDGATHNLTFDDLHFTGPIIGQILGDLMPQSPNKFMLEPIASDTVLTIVGIGNEIGDNLKFLNKDGRVGRVQVTATVSPHSTKISEAEN